MSYKLHSFTTICTVHPGSWPEIRVIWNLICCPKPFCVDNWKTVTSRHIAQRTLWIPMFISQLNRCISNIGLFVLYHRNILCLLFHFDNDFYRFSFSLCYTLRSSTSHFNWSFPFSPFHRFSTLCFRNHRLTKHWRIVTLLPLALSICFNGHTELYNLVHYCPRILSCLDYSRNLISWQPRQFCLPLLNRPNVLLYFSDLSDNFFIACWSFPCHFHFHAHVFQHFRTNFLCIMSLKSCVWSILPNVLLILASFSDHVFIMLCSFPEFHQLVIPMCPFSTIHVTFTWTTVIREKLMSCWHPTYDLCFALPIHFQLNFWICSKLCHSFTIIYNLNFVIKQSSRDSACAHMNRLHGYNELLTLFIVS